MPEPVVPNAEGLREAIRSVDPIAENALIADYVEAVEVWLVGERARWQAEVERYKYWFPPEEVTRLIQENVDAAEARWQADAEQARSEHKADWIAPYRCLGGHYFPDLDSWEGPNTGYRCECGQPIMRTEKATWRIALADATRRIEALPFPDSLVDDAYRRGQMMGYQAVVLAVLRDAGQGGLEQDAVDD